ncbi:hypothetical protein [Parasutterella excrementihominis]|uniref:hypothetical protein n=1 Tax=Parasutterella excrementihominis TaxID=487175 RepID=UPI00248AEB5A|nr:hypothetical protein [Parasutterella excrementihominis]
MAGSSFSFGTLGLISTGVSTLFNAFGAKSVTKYNNAIAQAQADIAKINADTMNLHYQQRLFAAEGEYQRETMQAAQVKARQKVALAANRVAIGVGSAAEQLASTDIVKKINLNRLESNAKSEAWGYRAKETDYRNQELMTLAKKQSASRAFTDSLLVGAGNMGMAFAYGKLMDMAKASESAEKPIHIDAISGADPGIKVYAISGAQSNLLLDQTVKTTQLYPTTTKNIFSLNYRG